MKVPDTMITPLEAARMLGKNHAETIKQALRLGTYPIGMAYRTESGRWVYDIPRKPFEEFVKTGKIPK